MTDQLQNVLSTEFPQHSHELGMYVSYMLQAMNINENATAAHADDDDELVVDEEGEENNEAQHPEAAV